MVATTGGGNAPFTLPTLAEIRAWVAAMPSNADVGTCGMAGDCVIARYLRAKHIALVYGVLVVPASELGQSRVGYLDPTGLGRECLLTDELNTFANLWDDFGREGYALTAAETLPIIDRVIAEVGQ